MPTTPPGPFTKGDLFDPTRVAWLWDADEVDTLIREIHAHPYITFDLENTGLDEHAYEGGPTNGGVAARIVLLSLTLAKSLDDLDPVTWLIPLSHKGASLFPIWQQVITLIAEALLDCGADLTAHNGRYDCRWIFAHTGVDLTTHLSWDTMVAEHLLDENTSTKLKVRAPRRFAVSSWADVDLSTPGAAERVPLLELGYYAARDTYWTWRVRVAQQHELWLLDSDEPNGSETADEREMIRLGSHLEFCVMPMVRNLAAVEQRGFRLDQGWVAEELAQVDDIVEKASAELVALFDPTEEMHGAEPSWAPTSNWFRAWSDHQVEKGRLRIDAMTGTGRPQWNSAVLRRQTREGNPVAERLLELRQAAKKAEFLRSWQELVTPDSRIHASYNVGRVSTGRLSSSEPNLQQVTKTLKPAFVPDPGMLVVEIDYSQIELRAAAFIARCEPMIEAYQRGDDLHRLMAAQITKKDPADVTPDERQRAKASNFGLLYMQSPEGFQTYAETAYGVVLTLEQAYESYNAFFSLWDGMEQWHQSIVNTVTHDGQVVSPLGRVRRVPNALTGDPYLVSEAARQACNAPVQSFASDIMQVVAADISGVFGNPVPDVQMVSTVHDSIVLQVPADNWKRAVAQTMRRMIEPHHLLEPMGCYLDVPLAVEATCGTRWGRGDVAVIVS
jgi:DNA polymerase I-like protein with 3'-5' exonuclease and polymerase domains